MKTRAWTTAFLLLASSAGFAAEEASAELVAVAKNRFEIPIRIDPDRKADIKSLSLYTSDNQGRSWSEAAVALPDQPNFPFVAQADGQYWFILVAIDQQNRREPPDPYKAAVGQKILVDTLKPEVKLRAERQNDGVAVSWEIREEHPDLATLKLEWRMADGPESWVPLRVSSALVGQTLLRVGEPVVVRASLKDVAKNEGAMEAKVAAAGSIVTAAASAGPADVVIPPPLATPMEAVPEPKRALEKKPAAEEVPLPPIGEKKPVAVSPPAPPPALPVKEETPPGTLEESRPKPTLPPDLVPSPPETAKTSAADLQVVNNRKVTMEYEVKKVGSSGVGSVDLHVTRDDGMTWKKVAAEHSAVAGAEATPGVLRRMLSVDLPEDGVYGFFLVVKSGAGLSLSEPTSNTPPQMRLKLDTKQPYAELNHPEEDAKHKDSLLLTWKALDDNLAVNPVTIQWAERPTGPWEAIGPTQMPNTGSYSWQVPPTGIPPKVYLRLTVRDTAGNVAVAETPTPVLIDLSKPEASFKGVVLKPR